MTLFFLTFFTLYGLLHFYAFHKARRAFALPFGASLFLALFMVFMVFAPVMVRLSERQGLESLARFLSYTGYLWMGSLFLFVSIALVFDLYRAVIKVVALFTGRDLSSCIPQAKTAFIACLVSSLAVALYGYTEALTIRTEHVVIRSDKIPKEMSPLRIVQITDVHLGLIVREERLKRILKEVKESDPDILVSTGDLVDGQINRLNGLAPLFGEISPRYGKFAITGNHEFYAGLGQALDFIRQAGFTLLRGEGVTVAGVVTIAGVDDPAGRYRGQSNEVSEQALLSGLPRERFTLFLKHRPLIDKGAVGLFDLQLSGHVHKGQIFPFSILTKLYYPVHAGSRDIGNGSRLYVSRGAGTWGPPIRFLSPPEVTVIELVSTQ